jgi:hypothetical protein
MSGPPQPSLFNPQLKPCSAHVLGMQLFGEVPGPESLCPNEPGPMPITDASGPAVALLPAPPHAATVADTTPTTAKIEIQRPASRICIERSSG